MSHISWSPPGVEEEVTSRVMCCEVLEWVDPLSKELAHAAPVMDEKQAALEVRAKPALTAVPAAMVAAVAVAVVATTAAAAAEELAVLAALTKMISVRDAATEQRLR